MHSSGRAKRNLLAKNKRVFGAAKGIAHVATMRADTNSDQWVSELHQDCAGTAKCNSSFTHNLPGYTS
jgi:hypothetical protein